MPIDNIDYDYVSEADCRDPCAKSYQVISKGKVLQTDSGCVFCCWKCGEVVKAFVLPTFYSLVIAGCIVYCYQIVSNYIHSVRHPIETLSYKHVDEYEAPGIAVFMYDNASFVSCEKSYAIAEHDVVRGRRRKAGGVSGLLRARPSSDVVPCRFSAISDYESVMSRTNTSVIVFQGPSNVARREYMKIHFKVDQEKADPDIGFLEFFPFANFSEWSTVYNSSMTYLQTREKIQDIWPLAVGFITYSRLAIRKFVPHRINDTGWPNSGSEKILFNPVNDIVKYLPPDAPSNYTPRYENMYAIFEWRDTEFEVIEHVETQNIWTTVGLMVTAILTVLRMFDLTKVIVRRQRARYGQSRLSFFTICTCCEPQTPETVN